MSAGPNNNVVHLSWVLAMRSIRARYRQSIFGIAWAVLGPIAFVVIFSFLVKKRVLNLHTDIPYPVFAYCGMFFWGYYSRSVRAGAASLVGNASLVQRVIFPRLALPLSAVFSNVIESVIGGVVLIGLLVYYSIVPSWTTIFVPLVFAVQFAFTLGLSLILCAMCVFIRDVNHALPLALNAHMFCTAVVYPIPKKGVLWSVVSLMNPMTPVLNAYRDLIFYGRVDAPVHLAVAAAISLGVLWFGWSRFHSNQLRFAEEI